MTQIFLSYRRDDEPGFTGRLYDFLCANFSRSEIFMDVSSLSAGVDFHRELQIRVNACSVLLAIIGPRWAKSKTEDATSEVFGLNDLVRIEIETALNASKTVIPVLVGRTQMPNSEALPQPMKKLSGKNAIRLTHESFETDAEKIVESIKCFVPHSIVKSHSIADIEAFGEGEEFAILLEQQIDASISDSLSGFRFMLDEFGRQLSSELEAVVQSSNTSKFENLVAAFSETTLSIAVDLKKKIRVRLGSNVPQFISANAEFQQVFDLLLDKKIAALVKAVRAEALELARRELAAFPELKQ